MLSQIWDSMYRVTGLKECCLGEEEGIVARGARLLQLHVDRAQLQNTSDARQREFFFSFSLLLSSL